MFRQAPEIEAWKGGTEIVTLPSRNKEIVLLQNDFILFGIYIFATTKTSLE